MSAALSERRVLLGVSGSIAAYKSVELLRALKKRGAGVQVVMTESATRFVGSLTFGALSGKVVITDVFSLGSVLEAPSPIEHVEQAHGIDLLVIAPATANTIARLACGLADDALVSIALATCAPILIAPAMEPGMWENAATVENVAKLRARGVRFIGPVSGELASGRSGLGRMSEPEEIAEACERILVPGDLRSERFLITAGPTWEAIDPVRVLSNRSTGAMGIEIAQAAAARGAEVTLVLGPTLLPVPEYRSLRVMRIESARQMLAACEVAAGEATVIIASAAVSDFRPAETKTSKLKRSAAGAKELKLVENPDVLATLAKQANGRAVIVGFAAETEDVELHARGKLEKKRCDLVIANLVGTNEGFGAKDTSVLAVKKDGPSERFGPASKAEVAQFVLDQVAALKKQGNAP